MPLYSFTMNETVVNATFLSSTSMNGVHEHTSTTSSNPHGLSTEVHAGTLKEGLVMGESSTSLSLGSTVSLVSSLSQAETLYISLGCAFIVVVMVFVYVILCVVRKKRIQRRVIKKRKENNDMLWVNRSRRTMIFPPFQEDFIHGHPSQHHRSVGSLRTYSTKQTQEISKTEPVRQPDPVEACYTDLPHSVQIHHSDAEVMETADTPYSTSHETGHYMDMTQTAPAVHHTYPKTSKYQIASKDEDSFSGQEKKEMIEAQSTKAMLNVAEKNEIVHKKVSAPTRKISLPAKFHGLKSMDAQDGSCGESNQTSLACRKTSLVALNPGSGLVHTYCGTTSGSQYMEMSKLGFSMERGPSYVNTGGKPRNAILKSDYSLVEDKPDVSSIQSTYVDLSTLEKD